MRIFLTIFFGYSRNAVFCLPQKTCQPRDTCIYIYILAQIIWSTRRLLDFYSFQWMSSGQLFFCYQMSSRKFLLNVQQSRRFGPYIVYKSFLGSLFNRHFENQCLINTYYIYTHGFLLYPESSYNYCLASWQTPTHQ